MSNIVMLWVERCFVLARGSFDGCALDSFLRLKEAMRLHIDYALIAGTSTSTKSRGFCRRNGRQWPLLTTCESIDDLGLSLSLTGPTSLIKICILSYVLFKSLPWKRKSDQYVYWSNYSPQATPSQQNHGISAHWVERIGQYKSHVSRTMPCPSAKLILRMPSR